MEVDEYFDAMTNDSDYAHEPTLEFIYFSLLMTYLKNGVLVLIIVYVGKFTISSFLQYKFFTIYLYVHCVYSLVFALIKMNCQKLILLFIVFIMAIGKKGVNGKHSRGSLFNSLISTGDIAKDMLTFKNTILNAKVGSHKDFYTPLPKDYISIFLS